MAGNRRRRELCLQPASLPNFPNGARRYAEEKGNESNRSCPRWNLMSEKLRRVGWTSTSLLVELRSAGQARRLSPRGLWRVNGVGTPGAPRT